MTNVFGNKTNNSLSNTYKKSNTVIRRTFLAIVNNKLFSIRCLQPMTVSMFALKATFSSSLKLESMKKLKWQFLMYRSRQ